MKWLYRPVKILKAGILCGYHRITDQISKAFSPGLAKELKIATWK
jgi:hypothetical protein